jgi:hypothetical protein
MTSFNSQICLALGGHVVKHRGSCREIANFVHVWNHVSACSVCVHAHHLTNLCGRTCLMKYWLF